MNRLPALSLAVLTLALLLPPALLAGDPVPDVDVILEQIPGGVIAVRVPTGPGVDTVELGVGKKVAEAAQPLELPAGWYLTTDKGRVVAQGPPTAPPFRMRVGTGTVRPPAKLDVRLLAGGRELLSRKGMVARELPPVEVRGSLTGVVVLPPEASPGETVMARIQDPAFTQSGGQWSLNGRVIGEVQDADDRAAGFAIKEEVLKAAAERPAGAGIAINEEEDLVAAERPAGAGIAINEEEDLVAAERPAGAGIAINEEEDLVVKPPPGGGTKDAKPPRDPAVLTFTLPTDLRPGDPISIRYVDPYGRTLLDVPAVEGLTFTPASTDAGAEGGGKPAIVAGTPIGFAGQHACVCGRFPGPEAWNGLRLDGARVWPLAAAGRVVTLGLPADATPGDHLVTGDPEAGFGEEDRWTIRALAIEGLLDQTQLFSGGSTRMRLRVVGTDEPVSFTVRNTTPAVISLEGGESQTVTTSGGDDNAVERTVRAVGRGDFGLAWELGGDWCPCAGH
jgi:hypothetical protein